LRLGSAEFKLSNAVAVDKAATDLKNVRLVVFIFEN